ncbi:unnamed protein product [Strongylus vulgaris]|uniref:Uncharacterized protein n=1 Tax=Strongylus vulgaris TaxID=40348 RepID=A0A3P7M435_STRVU|nr:unnamed protein product [Strongylus vulgaris]
MQRGDAISWWVIGNRNFGFGLFRAQDENESDFEIMDQIVPTFPWMPGPTVTPLDESIKITEVLQTLAKSFALYLSLMFVSRMASIRSGLATSDHGGQR